MPLLPNIIIHKQDKLKRIIGDIEKFAKMCSLFRGVEPNLAARFTDSEQETYEFVCGLKKKLPKQVNDPRYDGYIADALSFLKQILTHINEPIIFSNGQEMEPFDERYSFIHNPEHDGSHLGSNFTCHTPEGHVIMKFSYEEVMPIDASEASLDTSLYEVAEPFATLGGGRYIVDGYRFDIIRFTSFGYDELCEIRLYENDLGCHPILPFLKQHESIGETSDKEVCIVCGNGGCVHCEPHLFIR